MGIDERLVQEIVRRLVDAGSPDRIILFGSAATGTMDRDSDIDLLIVQKFATDRRREATRLRAALRGLGHPFDVIVISAEEFEESKEIIGGVAYPANRYGKVIYEAA